MADRTSKLNKFLKDVIQGRRPLLTLSQRDLFFEAFLSQGDVLQCLTSISTSDEGLPSLQKAVRLDLSDKFLDSDMLSDVFSRLRQRGIELIDSGNFLSKILSSIVEPPIFWNAYVAAFRGKRLRPPAQKCFAWILLQLITLPGSSKPTYLSLAEDADMIDILAKSDDPDLQAYGYELKNIVATPDVPQGAYRPGGRHDNDFADYRAISILPTAEEIISAEIPFLRLREDLESPATLDKRAAIYLDNQFRLLREDMLSELKDEIQIASGRKKGKSRGFFAKGLQLVDVHCDPDARRHDKWGIMMKLGGDLPQMAQQRLKSPQSRRDFWKHQRRILTHQSTVCLFGDGTIIGFASVNRDEDKLSQNPPVLLLHPQGSDIRIDNLLSRIQTSSVVSIMQINTAIFAFEPILKAIQDMHKVPLEEEILLWDDLSDMIPPLSIPARLVNTLRSNPNQDLRSFMILPNSIKLDPSQFKSLLACLTQRLAIIQGPPGTGKSFIGALIAKMIHDFTSQHILVVCYTNHALDQFLEDLLDIGIPPSSMVRIGGKGKLTSRTEPMSLYNQQSAHKMARNDYVTLDQLRQTLLTIDRDLRAAFARYRQSKVSHKDILDHIEFEDSDFSEAFTVPSAEDGSVLMGKNSRPIHDTYLLERWVRGENAGLLMQANPLHVAAAATIWAMQMPLRRQKQMQWQDAIMRERVSEVTHYARLYNSTRDQIEHIYGKKDVAVLKDKRIIGCTTTAAAKYATALIEAAPNVLLVEEAGEILESHILAALGKHKEQVILIGDHKQLRPKVNSYTLTVEKGDGYDLNMSLFERLVTKGYPHETLSQQHRMRPEISSLVRELTYPDLVDAPTTQNRPNIRGLRDNVVLINHDKPEDDIPDVVDRLATSSKQNSFEVDLVIHVVRYLAQQGYGTDSMVVLTPYLGQLNLFLRRLKTDTDPILNDLDSYDLVRAGLMTPASAKVNKSSLRLATIDNYQGEQADIVLISLTRSNPSHDIGFMFSPERLNVLLSRARLGLIMVGNTTTFSSSKKGGEIWGKLFGLLRKAGHVYEGLPVQCERHPSRTATLKSAKEFVDLCPDGGCPEACGTMLNCGVHSCPSKCHQLVDHSKMECTQTTSSICPRGHRRAYTCSQGPPASCKKCDQDAKRQQEKDRREYEAQKKKDDEQLAHNQRMAEIEVKIEAERLRMQDEGLASARADAIRQKEQELWNLKNNTTHAAGKPPVGKFTPAPQSMAFPNQVMNPVNVSSPTSTSLPQPVPPISAALPLQQASSLTPQSAVSASEAEWSRQKSVEGAMNQAIDDLMQMTGLEAIKEQVLTIKSKIELSLRQNVTSNSERFNAALLGNPGTGKTTVARLYAKFLTSVGVLPGTEFVETTGSLLANQGINNAKGIIDNMLTAGGGTIFIDEAYQLTSSGGGPQVLDYLLAEMENNVGKIVFLFAGYRKEMEKFFEHNPGLPSRVPYSMNFADYSDAELLIMLERMIIKHWKGQMLVEDGTRGLFCRIAVRRLGRGRGREGFGNARALENIFAKMRERQANRVQRAKRQGHHTSDYELLSGDIIGPDPATVLTQSTAYKKLKELTGLGSVKQAVESLFNLIKTNYRRELDEKEPLAMCLNRVFLGSPGTGKTTVAKLYGEILSNMGLLSNGEVIVKNPADFVGAALGVSEQNTKQILAATVGKVLVIDEAYMLYSKSGGGSNDPYKTAVIDTIVAEVQSVPGDDRCVLLLGYKDQMEEMFQNVNPGLARRFAIENAFTFEDFTDTELLEIMNMKLKHQDLIATDTAKNVAMEVLIRERNRPNFGNAGAIENLLSAAKGRHQLRNKGHSSADIVFEERDFDPEYDRGANAATNLQNLFKDIVGSDNVVTRLADYQRIAATAKGRNVDPRKLIPTTFIFKGPPGTGKTTVARKVGQIYYDMGLLASAEVVECSASDLVGEYVGHTGPKVKKLFEKALGRVLFIDEAYRLGEGTFAQEAMDELVGILTNERFQGKLIVVLAGYDVEMDRLLSVNPGLASRFPDSITFDNLKPLHALQILDNDLLKSGVRLADLQDPTSAGYAQIERLIADLSALPAWGNARDIKTLAKKMVQRSFANPSPGSSTSPEIILSLSDALAIVREMLADRRKQANNNIGSSSRAQNHVSSPPVAPPLYQSAPPPHLQTSSTSAATQPEESEKIEESEPEEKPSSSSPPPVVFKPIRQPLGPSSVPKAEDPRDHGVSDQIWQQLQQAKAEAHRKEKMAQIAMEKSCKECDDAIKREEELQRELERLQRAEASAQQAAKRDELATKLEAERLRAAEARREREEKQCELERLRAAEQKKRAEVQRVQAKLRQMGVCEAGFRWIQMSGGWRCAGGAHFISDAQLNS